MSYTQEEKNEFVEKLKARTKKFALDVLKLYQSMPKRGEYLIIGNQLLRAATSLASNYRAACRARSKAEFFSKMSIVVEEADESLFWLEVLYEGNLMPEEKLLPLIKEATELTSIMASARKNIY
ncbi:MAG: four helix bundle protein [Bacteroidales bacterium]